MTINDLDVMNQTPETHIGIIGPIEQDTAILLFQLQRAQCDTSGHLSLHGQYTRREGYCPRCFATVPNPNYEKEVAEYNKLMKSVINI